MDFAWAISQMKQGKKVIRQSWDNIETHYYYLSDGHIQSSQYGRVVMWIGLFEATDWKLHEEHFDLSKKAFITERVTDNYNATLWGYEETDIREFIKQLNEEIEKATFSDRRICLSSVCNIITKLAGERFK